MGGFFDSRKFLRTPGFAPDGLYDEENQDRHTMPVPGAVRDSIYKPLLPPLPDHIAQQDEQPSSIWGQMESAETAPIEPVRQLPPPHSPSRQMPVRERITLPDAPLPPKVGPMRQILGTAAELYLPQVGREIRQPGYSRARQEYENKVTKLQDEAKLNAAAAKEDSDRARTSAEMARAEAQAALKRRTEAQMTSDGDFTLNEGQARYKAGSSTPLATHAKPLPPMVRMAPNGQPYFEEGEKFVSLPPTVASSVISASKQPNQPNQVREYEAIVRGQNPGISDVGLAAEVAKMMKADRDAKLKELEHRANRPYGGGGGGDESAMSPEAVDMAAKMYIKTGQLPPMGAGAAGSANRRSIMNRAAAIDSGADIAGNKAGYNADRSSLQALQKTQDAIAAFENTTLKNLDTFLQTASGVVDTGSPLFNKPARAIASALGSTNATKFNTARQVAVTEAAKVLNNPTSNAALSDSARAELQHIMDPNASLAQIHAATAILKQDMGNRKASGEAQLQSIRSRIGGQSGGGNVEPPKGSSVRMTKTDPATGRTITRDVFPDKVDAAKAAGYQVVR